MWRPKVRQLVKTVFIRTSLDDYEIKYDVLFFFGHVNVPT